MPNVGILKRRAKASGFTLLELAIVLSISGILLGMVLSSLRLWAAYQKRNETYAHIEEVREALAQYYLRQGHFPCPGPRIDLEDDYPYDQSCSGDDRHVAAKRGVYFINMKDHGLVIEGGIPYRMLNIAKESAFDGWGNLLTYAVGVNYTQDINGGAVNGQIAIVNPAGKPQIDPPGSALWVILSHGSDGSGAHNGVAPQPLPCDENHADALNCSRTGQYVVSDVSMAPNAHYYDDIVVYRTWVELPPSPNPVYCHAGTGDQQNQLIQEGVMVKVCKNNDDDCQWAICHNGKLIPNVLNTPVELDQAK